MNKIWAEALVAVLVAVTQAILEVIKGLKKKGKAAT
jgi:DNA-binding winged helix-turn-helix (wHTH) protein